MSRNQQRARYEDLRSLGFASIGATYTAVGTPFEHPVRALIVWNDTDVNILISFDGTADKSFVPAGSGFVIDYCSNRAANVEILEQSAGETLYIKEEAAVVSSGSFYVTVVYASSN